MLQVKDAVKKYHSGKLQSVALDHVDLCFRKSEFVAVLGPSGAGKTTLLNLIGGLSGVQCGKYHDRIGRRYHRRRDRGAAYKTDQYAFVAGAGYRIFADQIASGRSAGAGAHQRGHHPVGRLDPGFACHKM